MSPFNRENSRLLLQHGSYFALYDQTGKFLKNLPFEVSASSEPRWARNEPNILYYHVGNQLKRLDVSRDSIKTLHVFSEYSRIDGAGESDICFDGNHLVLAGDRRFIFVFDLKTGKKGRALDAGRQTFDSLYITPDDHVTVTWSSAGDHSGIELFDREMTFLRRVAPKGGHMDVTRDADGEEVLLWVNAADPMPVCENGIVKIRLSDATQTCLIRLDWSLAMHVSATDNNGWFFVATYAPRDPDAGTDGWKPYTNEILQVKLDGSEIRRLAHHRSRPFDTYSYMPRVSASRDGTRIVFSSNYGLRSLVESAQAEARGGKKASLDKLRAVLRANSASLAGYLNPRYSDVYFIKVDPQTGRAAVSQRH
jgi:WD40 repeat protein